MQKVVLITGVSSGFGKAMAEGLSGDNYLVYGISRRPVETVNNIQVINADVTDKSSVEKAVQEILGKGKRIDVLINNAGMGIAGPVEFSSPSEIQLQMGTNFNGMVNMVQAVLPAMREQNGGMILNISSIGGVMGLPYQGFYSASKFAVEGLSESLRMELKPYNIKVVVIRPGDFNTHFTANRKILNEITAGNPYENQFKKTLSIIETDEKGGLKPAFLAKKIKAVIDSRNPRHHYTIASPDQKLAVVLKRLLPPSWFANILQSHYGIK
jgi:short-subunit dehydrogenase